MGSSSSKVTDYDRHEPLEQGVRVNRPEPDRFGVGVLMGTFLGMAVAMIVLAVTGVLVTVCGG